MTRLTLLSAVALLPFVQAEAATYFVSPSGSDKNSGTAVAAPFQTLQAAANVVMPGDTVYAMTGLYTTPTNHWNYAVLAISRSGTAGHPIVFNAYAGQHPAISTAQNTDVWTGVQITGSYITLQGFEVVGNAQYITLAQATSTYQSEESAYLTSVAANKSNPGVSIKYPSDIATNGGCIIVSATSHVSLVSNLVHDCPASGIDIEKSDYMTVKSNMVFNTSWWSAYDTSGINIHLSANTDATTGYRNYVLNNFSYNNGNTQPYYGYGAGGLPTDGEGIIFDTMATSVNGQPYMGRTLVMGNITYGNSGPGIEIYRSNHVDAFNNTAVMNNSCPVPGSTCGNSNSGQIVGNLTNDMNVYNNILVAPSGKYVFENWEATALTEGSNVMYNIGGSLILKYYTKLSSTDITQPPAFGYQTALSFLGGSTFSQIGDAWALKNTSIAGVLLAPAASSVARNAGTRTLDGGAAMLVTPEARNGNLDAGIDIGAVSYMQN